MSNVNFIKDIVGHAQRIQREFHILTSLIVAQAIHESNWGRSGLAVNGKNLFGVKGSYNGQSITMKTWEVYGGKNVFVDAPFRKYPSWYESIKDLADLYKTGLRSEKVNRYRFVLGETDYKKAAQAVAAAGYATDPNYATKLIRTIEVHNLTQYDQVENQQQKSSATKVESNDDYMYIVKRGDTLSGIASDKGVTVDYLVKLNNIPDKDRIYEGQRLKLKGNAPNSSSPTYHKVVKGDVVSRLAIRYGSTQKQIKDWNKLDNKYTIRIGQRIRVK